MRYRLAAAPTAAAALVPHSTPVTDPALHSWHLCPCGVATVLLRELPFSFLPCEQFLKLRTCRRYGPTETR